MAVNAEFRLRKNPPITDSELEEALRSKQKFNRVAVITENRTVMNTFSFRM
jgi:hypothetical protein